MKVTIPRVVRPVWLRDYAPEYGDQTIWMWVNPPRQMRLRFGSTVKEFQDTQDRLKGQAGEGVEGDELASLVTRTTELAQILYAWWAEMWSQHDDEETHWTADEVGELVTASLDHDPGLWDYIQEESLDRMAEYRQKKRTPPDSQP